MKTTKNKRHYKKYHPLELLRLEVRLTIGIDPEHETELFQVRNIHPTKAHPIGKDMEVQIPSMIVPWSELQKIRKVKNG